MSAFSPLSGLAGGSMIGLSAAILLIFNGDILGFSGIVSSVILEPKKTAKNNMWKIVFLTSFLTTGGIYATLTEIASSQALEQEFMRGLPNFRHVSNIGMIIAGFFVGYGTKLSNGCTSGHGICGLARLSKRSFASVGMFMSTAALAASTLPASFLSDKADHHGLSFPTDTSRVAIFVFLVFLGEFATRFVKNKAVDAGDKEEKNGKTRSKYPAAIAAGIISSIGLAISGMTKPYKLLNFLDMRGFRAGTWDGTLMCVMGGGLVVSFASYQYLKASSVSNRTLNLPQSQKIDVPLLIGSACFGFGWGLGALCPGPAIVLGSAGYPKVILFWWPSYFVGSFLGKQTKRKFKLE